MRRKVLLSLIGGVLLFSIGTSTTFAAINGNCGNGNGEASCLEVKIGIEEKFQFLQEKHIFHGKLDGKAHYEEKMTRAELASVLARMYHLEPPVKEQQLFLDVKKNHWANDAIMAVTSLGLMESNAERFEPSKAVTLEELAMTIVKVMELDTDQYASIWLPGSIWAQKYLAAVLAEDLLVPSEDYTKDALRSDFIYSIYAVYKNEFKEPGFVAGAIEPSLTVESLENGTYEFIFTVKNQTEHIQTITLSGQEFDYILYIDNKPLFKYSDNKRFLLYLKEIQLKQGEEYVMKTDITGLEKGEYKIEFWLADGNWPDARIVKEFIVD